MRSMQGSCQPSRPLRLMIPVRAASDGGAQELSPIFGDGLKDQAAAVWD